MEAFHQIAAQNNIVHCFFQHSKSGQSARPASPCSRPGSPHWGHPRARPCQPSGELRARNRATPASPPKREELMGESAVTFPSSSSKTILSDRTVTQGSWAPPAESSPALSACRGLNTGDRRAAARAGALMAALWGIAPHGALMMLTALMEPRPLHGSALGSLLRHPCCPHDAPVGKALAWCSV